MAWTLMEKLFGSARKQKRWILKIHSTIDQLVTIEGIDRAFVGCFLNSLS